MISTTNVSSLLCGKSMECRNTSTGNTAGTSRKNSSACCLAACLKKRTVRMSVSLVAFGHKVRQRHLGFLLLVLTVCCLSVYMFLYYCVTHHTSLLTPLQLPKANSIELAFAETLRKAILNQTTLPLLTLFTSWSEKSCLMLVRNLTLLNWTQLKPFVVPVLFTNSSTLAKDARAGGWHVLPISRAAVGLPLLKNMYLDAMSVFNTTAYAFANGDLLFTESLVATLMAVFADPQLPLERTPLLIIGTRTNVENVTRHEAATFANIKRVAGERGGQFMLESQDYFITDSIIHSYLAIRLQCHYRQYNEENPQPQRFDWDKIPEVVIGLKAYDNWLVANALHQRYTLVDATRTLLAVHQTMSAGNFEGTLKPTFFKYNELLLNRVKRINLIIGRVDCAPWRTNVDSNGRLFVVAVNKSFKYFSNCGRY